PAGITAYSAIKPRPFTGRDRRRRLYRRPLDDSIPGQDDRVMSGGTCAKPMSMTSGSCAWIGRRTDRRPSLPQTSGPNVVLMANVANQALELHLQEERTQPANRKARLQRDLIDVARLAVEIVEHVRLLTRGRQRLARLEVRLPDGQLEVGQDVFCRRCKDRS